MRAMRSTEARRRNARSSMGLAVCGLPSLRAAFSLARMLSMVAAASFSDAGALSGMRLFSASPGTSFLSCLRTTPSGHSAPALTHSTSHLRWGPERGSVSCGMISSWPRGRVTRRASSGSASGSFFAVTEPLSPPLRSPSLVSRRRPPFVFSALWQRTQWASRTGLTCCLKSMPA